MLKNIRKLFFLFFFYANFVSAEPIFVNRDLFYLPLSGEFQNKSQFSYESFKKTYVGTSSSDLSSSSLVLTEALDYSLYDYIVVGARLGFKTFRENSFGNFSSSASGFLDPSFSILYRINEQNFSPVFFDMSLSLSPSFGKRCQNNVLRGSNEFEFALSLGQEQYSWAYKVRLYSEWFSRELTSAVPDLAVGSRFDIGGTTAFQYDFDPRWAANLELGLRLPGKRQNEKSLAYEDSDYEFSFSAGPVYQYNNDLSAAFNFYTKYEKGNEYSTQSETRSYKASRFGMNLALNYIF